MKYAYRISGAAALAFAAVAFVTTTASFAAPEDKVFVCHATGSDSNPFVGIQIPDPTSAFPHLDSNGNPLEGHEQDFLSDSRDCEKKL